MSSKSVYGFLVALGLSAPVIGAELLVLNKGDATLAFIDPASGKVHATIPTGEGPHEIELSADGRIAVVTNYGAKTPGSSLSIIDVAARKERERLDLGDLRRPHGLTLAQGYVYLTAEDNRSIARYDVASGKVDWRFPTEEDGTHMVLASRDGARLFATNIRSNTVSLIAKDAAGQWQQKVVKVGDGPEGLDLTPDGKQLWTAHSRDGQISIIDVATGAVTATFDAKTKRSNRLKFTPDGKLVLVSDAAAGELVIIDAATRTERARLTVGQFPTGILVTPDGKRAYVAVSGDNRLAIVDLASLKIDGTIATGNSPDGMALTR